MDSLAWQFYTIDVLNAFAEELGFAVLIGTILLSLGLLISVIYVFAENEGRQDTAKIIWWRLVRPYRFIPLVWLGAVILMNLIPSKETLHYFLVTQLEAKIEHSPQPLDPQLQLWYSKLLDRLRN
jgi:hypothetical protein